MKRILSVVLALSFCLLSAAQSKTFNLGKWVEIQASILRELNRSYVDSLPVDRMEKVGVEAMLANLDPYTVYIPQEDQKDLEMMIGKTYGGIGAIIYKPEKQGNVIINEPYEGSPAQRAGLQCGDEIELIDGRTVHGLETKECSDKMKGEPGTAVTFRVKKVRSGEIKDVKIVRERIRIPDVEYSAMVNDTTGYILLSGFTDGAATNVRNEIVRLRQGGKLKKLVLDLRGNGGGLLNEAVDLVGCFVPKGSLVVSSRGKSEKTVEYRTSQEPVAPDLPLVVLVDSGSASASEIVSGGLQDMDRAVIMGSRTFGKGLVQSIRPMPYGGQLKLTTAKYYTPSGRCVQAMDYSRRNEDGSVGHIPDSLTREFKTAGGRTVRDGGGITPDVKLADKTYSRLTYSLVLNGVVEQYTLKYVREHESIPAVEEFHFNDYDDFVAFALTKKFDYRSSARTYYDRMVEELKRDGLESSMSAELEALKKSLEMEKEQFLRLKKDEIIPFIEEEIAVRYYYQRAGIAVRLRYDDQLKEALNKTYKL